jgi:hypothetical protein
MTTLTLACGPYFGPEVIIVSLIFFFGVKPLAYFAFIQAFRYRVCRPVPMRYSQAATLAIIRTILGVVIVVPLGLLVMNDAGDSGWVFSWFLLYGERVFSWWLVGHRWASLRGRRLLGWVISGTVLNAAIDLAVLLPFMGPSGWLTKVGLPGEAWALAGIIVLAIFMFLGALHFIGRRDSLKRRYLTGRFCAGCGYDLMGNLSGRCPECGQVIGIAVPHVAMS